VVQLASRPLVPSWSAAIVQLSSRYYVLARFAAVVELSSRPFDIVPALSAAVVQYSCPLDLWYRHDLLL
jgi:hypothetical protein